MQEFLRSTDVIDWSKPEIRSLAASLAGQAGQVQNAAACFNWVRDEVSHSFDVSVECVSCTASETLKNRTGICYAKSHLLAAILRANGIPTGFGYQRVALDDAGTAFCLHGFNFVHLDDCGWYAVDPRGNRDGIATTFDPPNVSLAFEPRLPGEKTFEDVFEAPIGCVVNSLQAAESVAALRHVLPDVDSLDAVGCRAFGEV